MPKKYRWLKCYNQYINFITVSFLPILHIVLEDFFFLFRDDYRVVRWWACILYASAYIVAYIVAFEHTFVYANSFIFILSYWGDTVSPFIHFMIHWIPCCQGWNLFYLGNESSVLFMDVRAYKMVTIRIQTYMYVKTDWQEPANIVLQLPSGYVSKLVPHSQMGRVRPIVSDPIIRDRRLLEMQDKLEARGYPDNGIEAEKIRKGAEDRTEVRHEKKCRI